MPHRNAGFRPWQAAPRSDRAIGEYDPHTLFLALVTAYVVLLAASSALGMGLFRALAYVLAIFMPSVIAIRIAGRRERNLVGMGIAVSLMLYYYGMLGSVAYNFKEIDWTVAIKLLMSPLFVLLGARVEARCPASLTIGPKAWFMLGLIVALPITVLALQLAKGQNVLARGADFSIFTNRNNAALFAVAMLGFLTVFRRRPFVSVLAYMIVGSCFGTLGVMIAVVFALLVLVASRENFIRYSLLMLALAAAMYAFAFYDIWIFTRFKPVFGTLGLLLDPKVEFAYLSYERLFRILNTTDLSLAFRIKHWHDLVEILAAAPIYNWVFGFGIGQSILLSQAHSVPHNDYLRLLFECGIVACAGFVLLLAFLVNALGRRWETVPFLAIALYMFSENLVDNFLGMAIFFYTGGAISYRLSAGAAATPVDPALGAFAHARR